MFQSANESLPALFLLSVIFSVLLRWMYEAKAPPIRGANGVTRPGWKNHTALQVIAGVGLVLLVFAYDYGMDAVQPIFLYFVVAAGPVVMEYYTRREGV